MPFSGKFSSTGVKIENCFTFAISGLILFIEEPGLKLG
jgi:hypothetical protein